uniref:Uncharacterized protein n=1 Tax=Aegilops tauschii subsp. strangulata TaxID=200361 RepID=A0A453BPS7_AEGTS
TSHLSSPPTPHKKKTLLPSPRRPKSPSRPRFRQIRTEQGRHAVPTATPRQNPPPRPTRGPLHRLRRRPTRAGPPRLRPPRPLLLRRVVPPTRRRSHRQLQCGTRAELHPEWPHRCLLPY